MTLFFLKNNIKNENKNKKEIIKLYFSKILSPLKNHIILSFPFSQFYSNQKIFADFDFNYYLNFYNQNALKIQKFFRKKIVFEYGRKWRFISWDYLKNHSDKSYNLFCSVAARQWKPIDLLTDYRFCFLKSGGCPYYPRTVFFCSCSNGECLDYLKPYVFSQSLKMIVI